MLEEKEIDKKIGNRLSETRKKQGMTAAELAKRVGISPQRISQWENGSRTLKLKVARELADVLDVEATWLVCLDLMPSKTSIKNPNALSVLDLPTGKVETTLPLPSSIDATEENNFAIKLTNTSMEPKFNNGDYIVLDKTALIENCIGELVVVRVIATQEILFRRLIVSENNKVELIPLNEDWPVITLKGLTSIELIGLHSGDGPCIYF